jgi:multidrug resistance efflux pump
VSGWKTIPRWLYETDAPDDQLQALYVTAARKKVAELEAERDELEAQLAQARAFLADAERALRRYQKPLNRG